MTRMLAPGLAALGMAAIVALTVPQAASAAEPGTSAGGDARITAASRNDRIPDHWIARSARGIARCSRRSATAAGRMRRWASTR